ncbi:hypothetical protein KI387_004774, partial [Taxus chinensis]
LLDWDWEEMEDIFLARWETKKKHNFVKEEEEEKEQEEQEEENVDDEEEENVDDEAVTQDSASPRKEASIFQFEGYIQRKK